MSFVKAVLKDKMFWLLIIIFIVSAISTNLTNGWFILIPVLVLLIVIFLWPYIELAISLIRVIKNAFYRFVKKRPVKTKKEASIGEIILDLGISFFKSALDLIALFFILVSLIVMNTPFFEENFGYQLFFFQIFLYFFAVFIYMIGKYLKGFGKSNNKS